MNPIRIPLALLALCAGGVCFAATPACEVDLDKAMEGQPNDATIQIQVRRSACVVIEGGRAVVSDTTAMRTEVAEWKDLGGGAREPRVITLVRQKAGTYQVYVKRSDMTAVFVLTD